MSEHILKNLHSLIRNSTLKYLNEFIWEDVVLNDAFKESFKNYLNNNKYSIEFLGCSSVVTSSSTKYIFVPNQWFVIASYATPVYKELMTYRSYLKKVSDYLGKKFDIYVKSLRDRPNVQDRKDFFKAANTIFRQETTDENLINESISRLWRFATDYSWWSGNKTIDRHDFYISVILNMLNLVNVSQGYVAEIVVAYSVDPELSMLTNSIDSFTNLIPDEEVKNNTENKFIDDEIFQDHMQGDDELETIPKPGKVRIKVSGESTLKEIKLK